MYENTDPANLDKTINRLGKKTTVYFIGVCVFFVMAFFYSTTLHYFFTVLVALIFLGVLLLYYMMAYIFIRLLRVLKFDDAFLANMLNNTDENLQNNGDTIKDREEIKESKKSLF